MSISEEEVEFNALSEEDVESLSDEEPAKKSRKHIKKKQKSAPKGSWFIEDEAEDDYDDEIEERGEEADEWITKGSAPVNDELYSRPRTEFIDRNRAAEDIAAELEQRHAGYFESYEDDYADINSMEQTDILKHSLLPTVRHPKLWMVKCKIGLEKMCVLQLMNKFIAKEITEGEQPLSIRSAVYQDHLKGIIYIEAESEKHVSEAIKGMNNIFQGPRSMKLVPIKEMVDVLTVHKTQLKLDSGTWVRIRFGTYKGDIAQIYEVDEAKEKATIKLVPRLNLDKYSKNGETTGKRKRSARMPAKFFNVQEVMNMCGDHTVERRKDNYTNEHFYMFESTRFKDGYAFKPMSLRMIETEDVTPSLDEVQKFNNNAAENGLADLRNINKKKVNFIKGDTVKVIEGDLKRLMGVVEAVDGDMVTIKPKHEAITDLLRFPSKELQKYFEKGNHVKVIQGNHKGETGLIVSVSDSTVILFSDETHKEVEVFITDIQEASEVSSGRLELGNYALHDLVSLSPVTVGCIVKVERNSFKVLDTNNNVQSIKLTEIGSKRNTTNAGALDHGHNPIAINDLVEVLSGEFKGRQGRIKHLYKYFAFLHSREMMKNAGVFIVKTGDCQLLGGIKKGSNVSAMAKSRPRGGRIRGPGGGRPRGGRSGGRGDTLMHKTVVIKSGNWKGYAGIVVEANDATVRVELHAKCKIIPVDRMSVEIVEDKSSRSTDEYFGFSDPLAGSRTPLRTEDPSMTPLHHGLSTPMRTPSRSEPWDPSAQPRTPVTTDMDYDMESSSFQVYSPAFQDPSTPDSGSPAVDWNNTPNISTPAASPYYSQSYPSTPGTSYSNPQTPGTQNSFPQTPGMAPMTPVDQVYTPQTPGNAFPPQTPTTPQVGTPEVVFTPQTPGMAPMTPVDQVYTPEVYTPMAEMPVEDDDNWYAQGIEVVVQEAFDPKYAGVLGFIDKVLPDGSAVVKSNTDVELKVPFVNGYLESAPIEKNDSVLVIRADKKGKRGVLRGIDGVDGIVAISGDIVILTIKNLAKLKSE